MSREPVYLEKILHAAHQMILAKGYSGTRVDDICEQAGVTKGCFYHHFVSKENMAAILLERFFVSLVEALSGGNWSELSDPGARVLGFLAHAIKVSRQPLLQDGCLIGCLTVDVSSLDTTLQEAIANKFNILIEFVKPHIQAALLTRGIKTTQAKHQARMLTKQFIAVLEGSIILGKATRNKRELPHALTCFKRMIEMMLAG